MNRIEEQLNTLKGLRDITLPDEARARMRAELLSYAELHAAPAAGTSARSSFSLMRFRFFSGVSAAALLIAALGGTAYASESALPGDALYPVKVGIAEPLQTALVPSDRGKAAWHAILAERRLDEAAQLAAAGKLSTTTQDQLAQNFNAQVTASQDSAERLQQDGDTLGALSARSDLEARLEAHAQILAVIDQHYATSSNPAAADTRQALTNMLALVESHEQSVVSSRIALEDAIAPGAAKDDTAAADASAAATTTLAIASDEPVPPTPALNIAAPLAHDAPVVQVETEAAARMEEMKSIIEHNAAFLKAFLPPATTTATSTATTTATSTIEHTSNADESGKIIHAAFDQSSVATSEPNQ